MRSELSCPDCAAQGLPSIVMAVVGPAVVNGQDLGVHVAVRTKRPTTTQAQEKRRDFARVLEPIVLGALLLKSRNSLQWAPDGRTVQETQRPPFRVLSNDSEQEVVTCSRGHRRLVSRRQLLRRSAAGETTIAP